MQFFINLLTAEDFKKFINYMAKEYYGPSEGDAFNLISEMHFQEDILFKYDEEEDDYLWTDNVPEEYLGKYYIHLGSGWDRMGSISYRVMLKLEEPKHSVDSLISRIDELREIRTPIARRIDESRAKKVFNYTQEDIDTINEYDRELYEDFGLGLG